MSAIAAAGPDTERRTRCTGSVCAILACEYFGVLRLVLGLVPQICIIYYRRQCHIADDPFE